MSDIKHSELCAVCGLWQSDAETNPEERARINAAFAGRKSGELADARQQLQGAVEALREIGALGGPLYLLEPNQGERPDPVAAGRRLREILDRYWETVSDG